MRKLLGLIGILLLSVGLAFGQTGSINLKNGYIVEHGGTSAKPVFVVLSYGMPAALSSTNGWIVSEGEFNNVRWYINNNTGAFTVPFGYSNTNPIPVTLNISTPGAGSGGSGFIDFSTYHTSALNSANLPSGGFGDPGNMAPMYPAVSQPLPTDDSYDVVDRFWFIYAQSYSPKPGMSNMTLSYINSGANSEIASPNVFTETQLLAQRFNSTSHVWGDWLGTGGLDLGGGNDGSGAITPVNFYRVWTLANQNSPLPIQISSFTAQCDNGSALIQWTSQSELNNDFYTVMKTSDMVHFETVGTMKGAGTTSLPKNYSLTDNTPYGGTSYYYLYQTDFDNNKTFIQTIPFTGCGSQIVTTFNAYNTTGYINVQINSVAKDNFDITLVNLLGQTIIHENHSVALGNNEIMLNNMVSAGVYLLNIKNDKYNFTKKLVVGVK